MEAGDPMRRLQLLNTKPDPGTMAGGDTEAGSVPGSVGGALYTCTVQPR